MRGNRDANGFRFILKALVVISLVDTFFIYGYIGNAIYSNPRPAQGLLPEPAEIAKLGTAR